MLKEFAADVMLVGLLFIVSFAVWALVTEMASTEQKRDELVENYRPWPSLRERRENGDEEAEQ